MNTNQLSRRHFLASSSLAAMGAVMGSVLANSSLFAAQQGPLYQISLAQWSLHRGFFGTGDEKLDNLDFAKIAREEFDIEAIEYVNAFFKDQARNTAYLSDMRKRAADHGVKSLLIMVDNEGHLGDPDEAARAQAVENHKKWLHAAAFLGCHSIRVNAASSGTREEQSKLATDGLARLTKVAQEYNLNVIVENHGGFSSDGDWLSEVIRNVQLPTCGTLPDFGNFNINQTEQFDRYKGVDLLMPYAKAVSAKTHDFDSEGNETSTDYLRMMKIVLSHGYHGFVGIEYEGGSLSEFDGIRKTKELLERVHKELAGSNA